MEKPFDEYVDGFTVNSSPYGASLNFQRGNPKPAAIGSQPVAEDVGTIRMSLEHMKAMTFILRRQMEEFERKVGVNVQIPMALLNALNIAPEDWQEFWKPRG